MLESKKKKKMNKIQLIRIHTLTDRYTGKHTTITLQNQQQELYIAFTILI